MSDIDFPYRIDERGRTASTGYEEHVRDMIEQVLLTSPGERVNRPEFGSGLLGMVFEPLAAQLDAALQTSVGAALQRWLGDVIEVGTVSVETTETELVVTVSYRILATDGERTERFTAGVTP
jgi:phage baseplate assembly protein W